MTQRSDITADMGLFGGDAKNLNFYVMTGPDIRLTSGAVLGALTLSVDPLKEAIPSGTKLRFGLIPGESAGLVVETTALAAFGATSITVAAITGALPSREKGGRCADVTGFTMAVAIYTDLGGDPVLTHAASAITPDEGEVQAVLTDTDTGTTLTPGTTYTYRLRRTDAGQEATLADGSMVLRK